jgi:hypothetical protein
MWAVTPACPDIHTITAGTRGHIVADGMFTVLYSLPLLYIVAKMTDMDYQYAENRVAI